MPETFDTSARWDDGSTHWNDPGDVSFYTSLITSEHANKEKFVATIVALAQPFADIQTITYSIPGLYDLDNAVGVQLDTVGLWIGRSRYLSELLTGVYFSLDTAGQGFDQGTWQGPYDPSTGLIMLPDEAYRQLLRAVIAANNWDGTIPGAYAVWATIFGPQGIIVIIQDNGDMTMDIGLLGTKFDAIMASLLAGGYLDLRPAGVQIRSYLLPSGPGPFFGFDVENSSVAGFDIGSWALAYAPSTYIPPISSDSWDTGVWDDLSRTWGT